MHILLSQSVLSSFLGAENENSIVTYNDSTDHELSSFCPRGSGARQFNFPEKKKKSAFPVSLLYVDKDWHRPY